MGAGRAARGQIEFAKLNGRRLNAMRRFVWLLGRDNDGGRGPRARHYRAGRIWPRAPPAPSGTRIRYQSFAGRAHLYRRTFITPFCSAPAMQSGRARRHLARRPAVHHFRRARRAPVAPGSGQVAGGLGAGSRRPIDCLSCVTRDIQRARSPQPAARAPAHFPAARINKPRGSPSRRHNSSSGRPKWAGDFSSGIFMRNKVQ